MRIDRYDRYERRHDCRTTAQRQADFESIDALLLKQSKGKIQLTREEKIRVQKYANAKRKERS